MIQWRLLVLKTETPWKLKVEKGPLEHLRSVVNPRQIVQDGDEADENEEENDEGDEGEEVLLRAQVFAAAQRVVQLPQRQAEAPRILAVSFEIPSCLGRVGSDTRSEVVVFAILKSSSTEICTQQSLADCCRSGQLICFEKILRRS